MMRSFFQAAAIISAIFISLPPASAGRLDLMPGKSSNDPFLNGGYKIRKKDIRTSDIRPACVMARAKGIISSGKAYGILLQDGRMAPILGLQLPDAESAEGKRLLRWLERELEGAWVKICDPRLLAMPPGNPHGLIYVEPVLESLQEIMARRGLAKLKGSN